jgi:hypothetical protein
MIKRDSIKISLFLHLHYTAETKMLMFVDSGADGRIILKLILERWLGRAWTGSIWLRIGRGGGLL